MYVLNYQPASALIIYIMSTVSELLTDMTTMKTKLHLKTLINLESPYAWEVEKDGSVCKVVVEQVKLEDLVKVYPGERIPVDGTVVSGSSISMNPLLLVNINRRKSPGQMKYMREAYVKMGKSLLGS